jgi:ADP-heptose:LPS heptosyltransferase
MAWKQSVVGAALWPLLSVERAARGARFRVKPEDVRSVLILEYMLPLGCCVHLTPLYEAIRTSRPEATITVATRGLGVGLLRHHQYIDHLIETPDPFNDLGAAARLVRQELARRGVVPECVLTGVSDQRTKIGLLGAMAGQGWRGGYTLLPGLYQRPLGRDPGLSQIANNLRLAAMLGCDGAHREPRVFFPSADAAKATAMLAEANPNALPLLVMVTQTSGGQRTGWHQSRFAEVIRHANEELGCAVVYVGTGPETGAVERLREASGGIGTSLVGRTSPTELAAVLAMSDYVVSLDTGTMHVARAMGVPMVVLGPSWQKPTEWMPLGIPHIRILRGEDRDDVPPGYRLDEIEATEVIAALSSLVKEYPASDRAREARMERGLSSVDHLRA